MAKTNQSCQSYREQQALSTAESIQQLVELQNEIYSRVLGVCNSVQSQMGEDVSMLDETLKFSLKHFKNRLNEVVENYQMEREALIFNALKEIERISSDSTISLKNLTK